MDPRTLIVAAIAVIGGTALAVAQTSIGTFKQWNAYTSSDAGGKMCFIASQPQDSKYVPSAPKSRDPVFFMITSIPAKNIRNEASTIMGYPFKPGSKVSVDVDGTAFSMFTDKDSAWIEAADQEPALIDAMKKGTKLTVQGTSRRGTATTDSYSLAGISAALAAIAKECP